MVSVGDVVLVGLVAWFFLGGGSAVLSTVVGGGTPIVVGDQDEERRLICSGQISTYQELLAYVGRTSGMDSEDYKTTLSMGEGFGNAFLAKIKQEKCSLF
jgi:hypothetical protein